MIAKTGDALGSAERPGKSLLTSVLSSYWWLKKSEQEN
jgi:hypothetical protein